MEKTFTLHGFNSKTDLDIVVKNINRDTFAEIESTSYKINAQNGMVYSGSTINAKKLSITFYVIRKTSKEVWETIKSLNDLFAQIIKEDGLFELVLSDEPDFIYDIYIENISEPSNILDVIDSSVEITVDFIAPNGYARKKDIVTVPLTNESNEIDFNSSANVHPVFELETNQTVSTATIVAIDEADEKPKFIEIGSGLTNQEIEELSKIKPKKKRTHLDKCNNILEWEQVTTTSKLYDTQVIGTGAKMTNTLDSIIPLKVETDVYGGVKQPRYYWGSNFGSANKFYGALYKKMLPMSESGEWEIRSRLLYNTRYARASNCITLQYLNYDGKPVLSIDASDSEGRGLVINVNMFDASKTGLKGRSLYNSAKDKSIITKNKRKTKKVTLSYTVKAKTTKKVGGVTIEKDELVKKKLSIIDYLEENSISLFYGEVRISRKLTTNNRYKYTVELIMLDENQNIIKRFGKTTYTDNTSNGAYSGSNLDIYGYRLFLGGAKIKEDDYIKLRKPYKENTIALTNISFYNTVQEDIPQPILNSGDYLSVDCNTSKVSVNGVNNIGLMNLGSDFFVLSGGKATILLTPAPSEDYKWTLRYEERKY